MARVNVRGTCVAARPGRPGKNGEESKYADLKVLVGESVVRLWGFRDTLEEAGGGSLPEVGQELDVTAYVTAELPKDGGRPYLSFKASGFQVLQPATATATPIRSAS
jgi:hypothetical protein